MPFSLWLMLLGVQCATCLSVCLSAQPALQALKAKRRRTVLEEAMYQQNAIETEAGLQEAFSPALCNTQLCNWELHKAPGFFGVPASPLAAPLAEQHVPGWHQAALCAARGHGRARAAAVTLSRPLLPGGVFVFNCSMGKKVH